MLGLALLCFNIGIEIGQLLFVAALFALVGLATLIYKTLSLDKLRLPVSYCCGSIASIWLIERLANF